MNFPYQIKSLEAYRQDYKKSVEQPEAFWASVGEPVSYTHLDVYKRQLYILAIFKINMVFLKQFNNHHQF